MARQLNLDAKAKYTVAVAYLGGIGAKAIMEETGIGSEMTIRKITEAPGQICRTWQGAIRTL